MITDRERLRKLQLSVMVVLNTLIGQCLMDVSGSNTL